MKYSFMVIAILVMVTACHRTIVPAAVPLNNTEISNANGQIMLLGKASLSTLQWPNYKPWFDASYQSYQVDQVVTEQLKKELLNKRMDIFLGTWCGDSKREVPRMLKILEGAGMDTGRINLLFVDNATETYKQSPQREEKGRNIHHVPTFILYDGINELGRIVESPVISLEKDLQAILQKKGYQPNYRAIEYWIRQISLRKEKMSIAALQSLAITLRSICRHNGEFNTYGYVLLAAKEYVEALNVFTLNTLLYPENAGVFDSLGEALEKLGDRKSAIAAYEKVLLLKPGDENATARLAALKK